MSLQTVNYRRRYNYADADHTTQVRQRWPATRSRSLRAAVNDTLAAYAPGRRAYQWVRLESGMVAPANPLLTSTLALYYKFDDLFAISGGPLDGFLGTSDYLGVCDLDTGNSSGDPVLVTDGVIADALNFSSDHINIGLNNPNFSAEQKALFDTYQRDFTLRFWIRQIGASSGSTFMELRSIGVNQWRFQNVFGTDKVTFRLFGQTVTSNEAIAIDGTWTRVIVSRDFANSLLSIKIDDNPTVTAAYIGTDDNTALDFFFIGLTSNAGDTLDIDELALWQDYVLTEDDMAYDWNSGAGRTPPFV